MKIFSKKYANIRNAAILLLAVNLCSFPLRAQDALSYTDYLEAVKTNNLQYMVEQYNIKIADAEVTAQKVFPDPELAFDASEEVYSLDLGYTIEPGKRKARVRTARTQAEIERLAVEQFFHELRAEASLAFLDAMQQKELLRVKLSSYDYMLQLSRSDSIRCALGEINESDVRQSRLEAATLQNDILTQQAGYRSALILLNRYMGRSADAPLELPESSNMPDISYSLRELIDAGLNNRADIMLATKNNKMAQDMLKLVKAERRPDIGLHIGYERDWTGIKPSRDMITAGISIPLKFSNINKGAVRSAQFAIRQSELQIKDVEHQVETEIYQAYFQYESAREKAGKYRSGLLDEAQKILDGIVFRYKRGETGILEVLVAYRTYNDVQEQYLETLNEHASALVELQRSCGVWQIKI